MLCYVNSERHKLTLCCGLCACRVVVVVVALVLKLGVCWLFVENEQKARLTKSHIGK